MNPALRAALAASGYLGTWETDLDTQVVAVSGSVAEVLDLDADAASAGLPVTAFLGGVHPEDRECVAHRIHEAHRTAGHFEAEFRTRGRGGRTRCVLARGRVEDRPDRSGRRCLGVIVDVTDSRRPAAADEIQGREVVGRIVDALIEVRPLTQQFDSPLLKVLIDAALFEMGTRLAADIAIGGPSRSRNTVDHCSRTTVDRSPRQSPPDEPGARLVRSRPDL